MTEFLQNSQLELFRVRRHGQNSRFRFLRDSDEGYLILGQLTQRFLVNRKFSTQVGARVEQVVFDAPEGFNYAILNNAVFGDLVTYDGETQVYRRYRISSITVGDELTERAKVGLTAAFEDTTPIFGIAPPDETEPNSTLDLWVYEHTQASPANVWVVNHNLGYHPIISIFETDGSVGLADAVHLSVNTAQLTFAEPTSGTARCI